jgi:hypothetical protein
MKPTYKFYKHVYYILIIQKIFTRRETSFSRMLRRRVLGTVATALALPGCAAITNDEDGTQRDCPTIGENPTVCEPRTESDSDILFYPEQDTVETGTERVDLVLENDGQHRFNSNFDDIRVLGRSDDSWQELLSGTTFLGENILPSGELHTWSILVDQEHPEPEYEYGNDSSIYLRGSEYTGYAFAISGWTESRDETKDYVATLEVA